MTSSVTVAIDWDMCLKVNNQNQDLIKELISMFKHELSNSMMKISSAYTNKDYDAIAKETHKLQGACSYTGALSLKALLLELETSAKHKENSKIEIAIKKVQDEIPKVQEALNHPPFE